MAPVIVIGGGPAGLFAAIFAAGMGRPVKLLEKMSLPGRKLLATGGGKCNIGNTLSPDELAAAFGRQGRFMLPALSGFSGENMRRWFAERGVGITLADDFHYYPATRRAVDVLEILLNELHRFGGEVLTECAAEHLILKEDCVTGVLASDGRVFNASGVVLASGGRGYPVLGGGTSGYALARQSGHSLVEPLPALTGLITRETWPGECAGISLKHVRVTIPLPRERSAGEGELLFTQHGISAYAVLDLSGRVSELLRKIPEVPLTIEPYPDFSREDWVRELAGFRQKSGGKKLSVFLSRYFPRRLAEILSGADDGPAAHLSRDGAERLIRDLTGLELHVTGTDGWDRAMVTRGGVRLKEVEPKTLESRLVKRLYFAGEVLDLDGPCGGYNLTWAMSSGVLAGKSAAERVTDGR